MNSEKILAKMAMIDNGILPAATGRELRDMLESLSKEDQRKFKRKFRKIWRKAARSDNKAAEILRLGEKDPTSQLKATRSSFIWSTTLRNSFKED
jgi:hypothetical protein